MKRYKDYMDGVEASDTLHEKLKNLEEPKKRPQPWAKWGAAAAAVVLVAGVGAWGLSRFGGDEVAGDAIVPGIVDVFPGNAPAIGTADVGREDMPVPEPDIAEIPAPLPIPDIAGPYVDPLSPPDWMDHGYDVVDGGYEVIDGEFAVYYPLPYLEWVDASALPQSSRDYSLAPPGAIDREATWDDVLLFAGGEKAMADHLLWDYHDWSGTISFLEDGTPCAALLYAKGDGMIFTLEVMLDYYVPSGVALPVEYYLTSRWHGTRITTVKNGGRAAIDGVELNEMREISFSFNGAGYKLTLYAHDAGRADEMCARFVRYAVDGGFSLSVLPYRAGDLPNKGLPPEDAPGADSDRYFPDCPYCADGTVHTHPYDPSAQN